MDDGYLSISELAHLSRTTRDTLLYYDKIGLIEPIARGANNYRRYSPNQIAVINVIHTMQSFGMSLEGILDLIKTRTPERALEQFEDFSALLKQQQAQIQASQRLLTTLAKSIQSSLKVDESAIEYHYAKAESIFLGPVNDFSRGQSAWDAVRVFYEYCRKKNPGMSLDWSAWALFSVEQIRQEEQERQQSLEAQVQHRPERYYLYRPGSDDEKSAGWYVTGYTRGNYGQTGDLYERLLAYIEQHGHQAIGPVYEEYPLNELSIPDPNNYLIRASIRVEEKVEEAV